MMTNDSLKGYLALALELLAYNLKQIRAAINVIIDLLDTYTVKEMEEFYNNFKY